MSQKPQPKQLLPATPRIDTGSLFGNSVTVIYQEWNRSSKAYRNKSVEAADAEEADLLIEHYTIHQLLEPLSRFLEGQLQALVHDYGNQARMVPVTDLQKNIKVLMLPGNQTCQRVAHFFYHNGGRLFVEAMPGRKSKYREKAEALLTEIQLFTRQHHAAKAVAA